MPSFTVTTEIDFEVFCTCGNGLCRNTETEEKYGRYKAIVEPCPRCSENKIVDLENTIEELKITIDELNSTIAGKDTEIKEIYGE